MPSLTPLEREAITDSMLKIQSVQASLEQIEEAKLPAMDDIHECLEAAHNCLRTALTGSTSKQSPPKVT
jgi:hypothetical protein